MKKFISIAAALATALTSTAMTAGAMFENIPSTRIWNEEFEMFDAMDSGKLITDVDGNGVFNIYDCFTLYSCTGTVESPKFKFEEFESEKDDTYSFADYDGSGKTDQSDAIHLIRYYIVRNKLSRKITLPSAYDSVSGQGSVSSDGNSAVSCHYIDISPGKKFSRELMVQADYLMAGYPVFCDMLESGEVNYDFNGDGRLFYDDINYLWVYVINSDNCAYMDFTADEAIPLPEDIYYPCQKASTYLRSENSISWIYEYALMYCFENYGADPEYLSNDYYESVFKGSGIYDFGNYAKQCYEEWLPKNEYLTFNGARFNREYLTFLKENSGENPIIPDTNGDGVLDVYDTFNTYIYMEDMYSEATAETTILPAAIWSFFTEKCDLNKNGLSGDLHDLDMLNLFVTENCTEEELYELFDNYQERLKNYIAELSEKTGRPAVKYKPEKYSSPVALSDDTERTGDANADGIMDLSDTVLIMQSLANPDKYKLSAIGRFNADVNNTGDGITLMDAQSVQNRLLGLE